MKSKGNYDFFAKDYDKLFESYREDVEFYKNLSLKSKGKILEVACGTGRVYLEVLKCRKDIYGIDISQKMLNRLKEKAKLSGLNPKVYRADMKDFKLNHKFSLIIIPFRSFLHNLTIDEQIKSLKNFKKHLEKGGKLILNFYSPDPKLICETKEKEKTKKEGTYFVDKPNQIIEVFGRIDKKFRSYKLAYIYKREFELLLKLAGFKSWKVYGGFNFEPLKDFNQEMVWIVNK